MLYTQVDWTLATDLLIDLFFMSDIILNFNTGFISDQVSPMHVSCLPFIAQPTMTKASALTTPRHTRGLTASSANCIKKKVCLV